jgi:hypothetical protein
MIIGPEDRAWEESMGKRPSLSVKSIIVTVGSLFKPAQ